ncbi:MAG: penicillin acylase family protein [Thermoanaerobaculia bacterium]
MRIPIAGNISDVLNLMVAPELTAEGYAEMVHGASYVQIVGFDAGGPAADAVLLFGQSSNPASPYYYDQLQRLWAEQRWNRLPFSRAEIEARAIARIRIDE